MSLIFLLFCCYWNEHDFLLFCYYWIELDFLTVLLLLELAWFSYSAFLKPIGFPSGQPIGPIWILSPSGADPSTGHLAKAYIKNKHPSGNRAIGRKKKSSKISSGNRIHMDQMGSKKAVKYRKIHDLGYFAQSGCGAAGDSERPKNIGNQMEKYKRNQ